MKDFQTRNRRSFEKLDSSVPLKKIKKNIETGKKEAAARLKYEERLADKRRRGAPKREAKARAKETGPGNSGEGTTSTSNEATKASKKKKKGGAATDGLNSAVPGDR